jgi:hypothetical protein
VRGGVAVETDEASVSVPVVVGAGGHHCPVARAFGEISGDEDVVVTQESETRVGAERLRTLTSWHGSPELFAEPDFHGYGWYFTKGDFLNVGVGAMGGMPIGRRLERLRAGLRASGRLPDTIALTPFRGHAYSVRRTHPRRLAGEHFVLVGDAAGLARDFSGEGIGPAVHSARLAADAIVAAEPHAYPERVDAAFDARRRWSRRASACPRLARRACGGARGARCRGRVAAWCWRAPSAWGDRASRQAAARSPARVAVQSGARRALHARPTPRPAQRPSNPAAGEWSRSIRARRCTTRVSAEEVRGGKHHLAVGLHAASRPSPGEAPTSARDAGKRAAAPREARARPGAKKKAK